MGVGILVEDANLGCRRNMLSAYLQRTDRLAAREGGFLIIVALLRPSKRHKPGKGKKGKTKKILLGPLNL